MPRKWILAIALGTSLLLLARFGLPALVENQLNRVTPHAPWVVSREAQSLHQTLLIADLHADPLLWERDWLHRSRRGHTDLPRLQEGGVALQAARREETAREGEAGRVGDGGEVARGGRGGLEM